MSDMADVLARHQPRHPTQNYCQCGERLRWTPTAFLEHQRDMLAAAGFGPVKANMRPMTVVEIERRDNPERMEAARLQIRADARASRQSELQVARAEALEQVADEADQFSANVTNNNHILNPLWTGLADGWKRAANHLRLRAAELRKP